MSSPGKRPRPRRRRGDGSITSRKDGTYQASYLPAQGERRVYLYAKTLEQIRKQLSKALKERDQGVIQGSFANQPLYLAQWLETARANIRPNTYDTHESIIRVHLVPALGRIKLVDLNAQHIQYFLSQLDKRGASRYTQARIFAVLKRALKVAVRWGLIAYNPADRVDAPRIERKEQRALTEDEARRLLAAVHGDKWEALYTLALTLGLRRGEALALRWADVNLVDGKLSILRTLQKTGEGLQYLPPKTRLSRRTIKLPAMLVRLLLEHRSRQQAAIAALRGRSGYWEDHDLLFPSALGTPRHPDNYNRHFRALLKRAAIEPARLHDLRHTAATLMRAQRIPDYMISRILGHATIRTTHDLYGHTYDKDEQAAADALDEFWGTGA